MPAQRKTPTGGPGFRYSKGLQQLEALYGPRCRTDSLPKDWRGRLPNPAGYYAGRIEKLGKPNASGWAQGRCPFHDDHNASLSVHVTDARGGFTCFACGAKGDLLTFHMEVTGLPFKRAVRDLLGVRP